MSARTLTYGREVFTTGLDSLDEQAAGCRVAMHGADEVLHGRLVGQADEVLDVVHDEPRQVLGVMQVLTLRNKPTSPRLLRLAWGAAPASPTRAGPSPTAPPLI